MNDFFSNVGGSGNYNVNTTYYDANQHHIINSLSFSAAANTYNDNYSIGKDVGTNGIERIVAGALKGGHLPVTPSSLYFVVTAPDVSGRICARSTLTPLKLCPERTSSTPLSPILAARLWRSRRFWKTPAPGSVPTTYRNKLRRCSSTRTKDFVYSDSRETKEGPSQAHSR